MYRSKRHIILSLRFIPFVLTNGMNLFPVFILAQFFIQHKDVSQYVLPLLLYYSFKTTTLVLIRIKPISMLFLLKLSICIGICGSILGYFSDYHILFALLAGMFLGVCSGTLYPSYLTVQFHEKELNDFGMTTKEQLYALGFAFMFSSILFKLVKVSLPITFLFLGFNLLVLLMIISVYPSYSLPDGESQPSYSVIETLFLFLTGFFSIFIIKGGKKLGISDALPVYFLFLLILILLYVLYIRKMKPMRHVPTTLTQVIIYKGMLTNFILVFCTFYQLINEGSQSIYMVYSLYLSAIILAPFSRQALKKIPLLDRLTWQLIVSFLCLLHAHTFYIGVFLLSLASSQLNQELNVLVYKESTLPKDNRLAAKYRLNNVGSVIHQVLMMFLLYVITHVLNTVSLDDVLRAYSDKNMDPSAYFPLDLTKIIILIVFTAFLFILRKQIKKELPYD